MTVKRATGSRGTKPSNPDFHEVDPPSGDAETTTAPATDAPERKSASPEAGTSKTPPGKASSQRATTSKTSKRKRRKSAKRKGKPAEPEEESAGKKYLQRAYPQKTLEEALTVPKQIKEKNNGNPWATEQLMLACGYKNPRSGNFVLLTSASRDYDLTIGTWSTEKIELSPLGRKVVFPGNPEAERKFKIEAFFKVDIFKKVFDHYGGSKNLPETTYLGNTLQNDFNLPRELHEEFITIFKANCKYLKIEDGQFPQTVRKGRRRATSRWWVSRRESSIGLLS